MKLELYVIIAMLIMCFIGGNAYCNSEASGMKISDKIQEFPFTQQSWLGENISKEVRLRDLHLWGENEYKYSGKIKVGAHVYQAEFTKKLRYVLLYQGNYYFICQEYFGWGYEFDFYTIPKSQDKASVKQLCITDVPLPILEYQFPSASNYFLCTYETGVLLLLLKKDPAG